MPHLRALQIHAFTDALHGGSPAGVIFHDDSLPDADLRKIATDFGPSVSAFISGEGQRRRLRWFTREGAEVQTYCGHATFAAAHAALPLLHGSSLEFDTISGLRRAAKAGNCIKLDIPQWIVTPEPCPPAVAAAIGAEPSGFFRGSRDCMLIFDSVEAVRNLAPDFALMLALGDIGFIAAAKGTAPDEVVFRFFCPGFHIGEDEDPATGSAQSSLGPYWLDRLSTNQLAVRQLSARGGQFLVERRGESLSITSPCTTFFAGEIHI